MIIPYYGPFAKRISPRDNIDSGADETNNNGNLSPQNQAIVGAVVGGVALIAVTAGIFIFFIKKQKWDRIRQHEEALLALHAPPPAYDSGGSRSKPMSRSLWSRSSPPRKSISPPLPPPRPITISHPVREVEEQPPSYDAQSTFPIPLYNPSSYHYQHQHQQFRPSSALTVSNGCLHYVAGDVMHGQRSSLPTSRLPLSFEVVPGYRNTIQVGVSGQGQGQGQDQARGEPREGSRSNSGLDVNVNLNTSSSPPIDHAGETRSPRKPKPVLSRLITNFG